MMILFSKLFKLANSVIRNFDYITFPIWDTIFRYLFIILVVNISIMERALTEYELIPNRIILRSSNYAHRKILINKKFEWLNKYISSASPKIFTSNSFVSNKSIKELKRNRIILNDSKLNVCHKTSEDCQSQGQSILGENSRLRKTVSSQLPLKINKKQCIEQSSAHRFFRSKKNKSQFTKSKISSSKKYNQFNSYLRIDDSQVKPWNTEISCEDDEGECFKQNARPV